MSGAGHRGWIDIRLLRASENQLLNSGNLLSVIIFLQLDELGFHIFHKRITFSTLELCQKFFCNVVRSDLKNDGDDLRIT